ncbi:hypothetical protein GE061_005860 [Apolygus lucorum]|uniref:Uncharacterized protein n=1 Tax=Apolygus lucorum TaxID=248454 RepID=A0A8S9WXD8_APOLU|nr:hypothetical protein GE061_005860 [Apolygus lucorum]
MLRNWVIFNKVPTEQLIRVKQIHVFEGGRSALYVTSGDIVYGIGANGNYNLLGLSGRHRQFSLVLEPVSVERLSLKSINTIAVGDYFGVANNTNGELYHWGRRMDKRRGILLPHQVKCPYFVVNVACGSEFFVILTKEQKVFFRGTFQQNDHPILEFTEVSSGLTISSISCGIFHAAMLTTDGQVYNCGYDHHATYRSWKSEEGLVPKMLDLRETCTQVVCGRRSTVCLLSSGTVWASGENDNLGVESENSVMKHPSKVRILEPIRELAATWYSNIFAASSWSGRIYCWGCKIRWPAIISDACVLIDAFRNKETPSSLGLVPVAPQLSPCSSFNSKTTYRRSVVNIISPEVVAKLERSLSANDLSTSHYPQDKELPDRLIDDSSRQAEKPVPKASQQLPGTSKSNKNLPPGLGLLITAGKLLATRPTDRQLNSGVGGVARRRAVSPENHPAKNPKPQFSIASASPADPSLGRSQSMENLDLQPSPPNKRKPRVLSMLFGRNPNESGRKTPLASPESETAPSFYVPRTPESEKPPIPEFSLSHNPFHESSAGSIYPTIPQPTEECPPEFKVSNATNKNGNLKNKFSSSNPFLYDPMDAIKFEFPPEEAQCYVEKNPHKEEKNSSPTSKNYNPGTKAMLKYYCLLADIKSDVVELQTMINDLTTIIQNL